MELILAATAIFVIASPFINAGINRVNWTPKQKSLVAWVVAIIIAVAYVLITGGIANIYQLFIAAPAIYGYSQAVYTFFVKNIATKFEAITSPGALVAAPSEEAGKVDITTDATIAATGDNVSLTAPVEISAPKHLA
jgi:NhaP-type Na+/H+ and K+/H+ antiporter